MDLYVTPRGRWAGTQVDAKALAKDDGSFIQAKVPTDKPGLIGFLNRNRVGAKPLTAIETNEQSDYTARNAPRPTVYHDHNTAALSDGMTLTDAEEFIQNADAAQLARLAENVCFRMKELMERVS